jgi:integrase
MTPNQVINLQTTNTEPAIINSLIKMKASGRTDTTIKTTSYNLRRLQKLAKLSEPEAVKIAIANLPNVDNQTRAKYAQSYDYYAMFNGIQWTKPQYRWERKIPYIPTTENIDKIISASTPKFATIFTILKETGLEAHELSSTTQNEIDQAQGIIYAKGCKGHNSRPCKLKPTTAQRLREYLARYTKTNPFPKTPIMSDAWRKARQQATQALQQPDLNKIPMRNLRHYYATHLYDQTKDILLVKQRLGHKKLETTMFYTTLLTFEENEEYTCKAATNLKEATELIEHGFQYVTEMDGAKLFKKRK